MVYNSDSYVVVQFDAAAATQDAPPPPAGGDVAPAATAATGGAPQALAGFEIVDKQGRADVFLHGAVAAGFQQGAQALLQQAGGEPDMAVLDDYIAGYITLGRQPLAMH